MIQRYTQYDDDMQWSEDGDYVLYDDHEAAIAEARKQERERCIAELEILDECLRLRYESLGIREAIKHLKKGLTQ